MDAYRVLGVSPAADEVAIRAAYLALMKRCHPDQPGADPERAKAVAAAYRLVGDPVRRAAYDRGEEARAYAGLSGAAAAPIERRRRAGPAAFVLISAATLALAYVAVTRPVPVPLSSPFDKPRPVEPQELVELPAPPPAEAERLAEPVASDPLTTDLPEVVLPDVAAPVRAPVAQRPAARDETRPPSASARAAPRARPRQAPGKEQLAALERHQIILYNQSFLAGDSAKRARLMESRAAFLKRLEGCDGTECRRDAYLERNGEIVSIMSE